MIDYMKIIAGQVERIEQFVVQTDMHADAVYADYTMQADMTTLSWLLDTLHSIKYARFAGQFNDCPDYISFDVFENLVKLDIMQLKLLMHHIAHVAQYPFECKDEIVTGVNNETVNNLLVIMKESKND